MKLVLCQNERVYLQTNVVEAHEHAIFGAKTEPMDQTVEGPLLRHQRHIDDNSNATTVSTTLTDKYGDAALLMPDFVCYLEIYIYDCDDTNCSCSLTKQNGNKSGWRCGSKYGAKVKE
jgi:hypothetical protein